MELNSIVFRMLWNNHVAYVGMFVCSIADERWLTASLHIKRRWRQHERIEVYHLLAIRLFYGNYHQLIVHSPQIMGLNEPESKMVEPFTFDGTNGIASLHTIVIRAIRWWSESFCCCCGRGYSPGIETTSVFIHFVILKLHSISFIPFSIQFTYTLHIIHFEMLFSSIYPHFLIVYCIGMKTIEVEELLLLDWIVEEILWLQFFIFSGKREKKIA